MEMSERSLKLSMRLVKLACAISFIEDLSEEGKSAYYKLLVSRYRTKLPKSLEYNKHTYYYQIYEDCNIFELKNLLIAISRTIRESKLYEYKDYTIDSIIRDTLDDTYLEYKDIMNKLKLK